MKKRIYLLLLSFIIIFFSCKDNSAFVEQLFTDEQISQALGQCLKNAVDTTCNTLCIVDTSRTPEYGYTYYDAASYRIELPSGTKRVVDILTEQGYKNQLDTLIVEINRAAEQCGNNITRFWTPVINNITFPNPNLILHGGNSAITDFVKEKQQSEFLSQLVSSILAEQFSELKIITKWNELQEIYYNITQEYSSTDILTSTAQQMVAGFFKRMAIAEKAIRDDPNLRGNTNSLLYRVFATL